MIARNGVILIDQVEAVPAEGAAKWDAVVEAATSRFLQTVELLNFVSGAKCACLLGSLDILAIRRSSSFGHAATLRDQIN
jgi:hypothetical protein